jgi:eukaryotic-like serine/threonine-protein kinase
MELAPGFEVTPSVSLVRKLGSGGMGSVWIAEHKGLRSEVVVKFMASELLKDEGSKQRFSREAAAAALVRSPHVVQILDHGITAGAIPFIVMELLDGHDLGAHLDKVERLSPRDAVTIMNQLGKALSRAHDRGIVHRDLKPENIFLCDMGGDELFVKVLDFGIAKAASEPFGVSTITGVLVGSPYYMSPEQLRALKDIDLRTDIWSVGVVMYQALTGQRPFIAENLADLAVLIHSEPPPVPSTVNPELPAEFDDWFLRACSRDRKARFQSMKEMSQTLERALSPVLDATRSGKVTATTSGTPVSPREEPAGMMRTTAPVSASTLADAPSDTPPTRARPLPRRTVAIAAGAAAALVLVGGAALLLRSGTGAEAETAPSTAPPSAATPPESSAMAPPVVEPALLPSAAPPPAPGLPEPSAALPAPEPSARAPDKSAARATSRPSRGDDGRRDDERRKKAAPATSAPAAAPKPTPAPASPPPATAPPPPTSRERPI